MWRRFLRASVLAMVATTMLATPAVRATETTQYWYDNLGQLVDVTYNNGENVSYTFDGGGNRTEAQSLPPAQTGSFSMSSQDCGYYGPPDPDQPPDGYI